MGSVTPNTELSRASASTHTAVAGSGCDTTSHASSMRSTAATTGPPCSRKVWLVAWAQARMIRFSRGPVRPVGDDVLMACRRRPTVAAAPSVRAWWMARVNVVSHRSEAFCSVNACSDWRPSPRGLATRTSRRRSALSLTTRRPSGSTTASVHSWATLRTSAIRTSLSKSGAPE